MADSTTGSVGSGWRRAGRGARRLVVRVYALLLAAVVLCAGIWAVVFLMQSVFRPRRVPERFLAWAGRLEAEALRNEQAPGVTNAARRAPVEHYHGVEEWFRFDPHDGCTASGCHEPLPHTKHKETRAFANLHATFLRCTMCHLDAGEQPMPVKWVRLETGEPTDEPPPLLQLLATLETAREEISAQPAEWHDRLVSLVRRVAATVPADPLLHHLRVVLETAEPGSPVWREAVRRLEAEAPLHARGEYGSKLAPAADFADPSRPGRVAAWTRQFLAAPEGSAERQQAYDRLHEGIVARPAGCVVCHGPEATRVDLEAAGYSPAHVRYLRSAPVAQQIQHIHEGKPFHLFRLWERGDGS